MYHKRSQHLILDPDAGAWCRVSDSRSDGGEGLPDHLRPVLGHLGRPGPLCGPADAARLPRRLCAGHKRRGGRRRQQPQKGLEPQRGVPPGRPAALCLGPARGHAAHLDHGPRPRGLQIVPAGPHGLQQQAHPGAPSAAPSRGLWPGRRRRALRGGHKGPLVPHRAPRAHAGGPGGPGHDGPAALLCPVLPQPVWRLEQRDPPRRPAGTHLLAAAGRLALGAQLPGAWYAAAFW